MEKSYRIKANVGKDQVLNVQLKRDVDLYEILSLKLSQERFYKLQSSGYGVIVGRVLANDAFGIPNAKVSVFIPISNQDKLRADIKGEYPYTSVNSYDSKNRRYNILPDYKTSKCHKPVGSLPNKRMVLDEDAKLEIYDKYYKYTTVTNKSGDYMIFGVPVGEQIVHTDIDLSDIGILSQRPSDLIYKGYSVNLFESPSEFKTSTNLNDLPQIISENSTVNVYPFWGDSSENEIAITRKDIRVQYKFEPTCVFIGSVITDSPDNSVSQKCTPSIKMGEAGQLTPSDGTIEMIRKTIDNRIENFNIKGNQLIDSSGVWCYQIPMNLDYVCTDEYGNIVPTSNPSKGIPTRTRVRFRFTLSGSENESLSSHSARYLVPNNPDINGEYYEPFIKSEYLDGTKNNSNYYEFGTLTNDECFRDLLWNKVYTVKSYIPRIQKINGFKGEKNQEYLAIKGVNKNGAGELNPFPFNKLNLNYTIPVYQLLKEIWEGSDSLVNFWDFLNGKQYSYSIDAVREKIIEDMDGIGLDFYNDWINGCLYFPKWYWYLTSKKTEEKGGQKSEPEFCDCDKNISDDGVKLCVLNNCSLSYNDDELNILSNGLENNLRFFNWQVTKITYGSSDFDGGIIKKAKGEDGSSLYYYSFGQKRNPDNGEKVSGDTLYNSYVRLFSTDIVLLGSISDCDMHGIPKVSTNYPSTTANIPPIGTYKPQVDSEFSTESDPGESPSVNGMNWGSYWFNDEEFRQPVEGKYENRYWGKFSSGLFFGFSRAKIVNLTFKNIRDFFWVYFGKILGVFNIESIKEQITPITDLKTCVNAERICELGVTNDSVVDETLEGFHAQVIPFNSKLYSENGHVDDRLEDPWSDVVIPGTGERAAVYICWLGRGYYEPPYELAIVPYYIGHIHSRMDGLITRKEIQDADTRSLFATLNSGKLNTTIPSDLTGYKTYSMYYFHQTNFDGRMEKMAPLYTSGITNDVRSKDYLDFRLGSISNSEKTSTICRIIGGREFCKTIKTGEEKRHFYGELASEEKIFLRYSFPLYDNSFYFYFGLMPGHTAINEFYKNFISSCFVDKKEPFDIKTTVKASSYCGLYNGYIKVELNGAIMPYSVSILNSSNIEVVAENNLFNDVYITDSNLPNGNYTITVIDSVGQKISKKVTLKQERVRINFEVENQIEAKYVDGQKDLICQQEQYATIGIYTYEIDGQAGIIDHLGEPTFSHDESDPGIVYLKFEVNPIVIIIRVADSIDKDIQNYICQEDYYLNQVHFGRPGNFLLRVAQYSCSASNYSDYTFSITDASDMDLVINNMPLKFFVGLNENDLDSYAKHFHDKNIQANTIESVRGWFGVHDPKVYDESFYGDSTGEYKEIWSKQNSLIGSNDILLNKFRMLFNVASNAYVSDGTTNKFTASYRGSKILLRAAYPKYGEFRENEQPGTFKSYITCNNGETDPNGVNNSANIVAENYKFTDNDGRIIESQSIDGYAFNPKYDNSAYCAGNYFAIFSNNANYVGDGCKKIEDGKKITAIPYRANDLSSDGLCAGDSYKSEMLASVYNNPRYFRTEFIDRRLDYDFAYVTPCKTRDVASGDGAWSKGRVSGITYNGIEMAYNGNYLISSINDDTEYNYNESTYEVSCKNNIAKKLYKSDFDYGGTRTLDLRELYFCKNRKNISAETFNNDGIMVHDHSGDAILNTNEYDNFGLGSDKNTILGYPTKRLLDIYNIPYGNGVYKWTSASCLYDNNLADYRNMKALKADDISHAVNFENSLNIETNDVVYKISNADSHEFSSNNYKCKFTLNKPSIEGLTTTVKSIKLITDTRNHDLLSAMKTENGSLENIFESHTTGEDYSKRTGIIEITKAGLLPTIKFIGIGLYYVLENSTKDNLLKRIRLFNLSNYYNIGNIVFEPHDSGDGWIEVIEMSGTSQSTGEIVVSGETEPITTEGTTSSSIEKLNFSLKTEDFEYDDISSINMDVTIGSLCNYTPVTEDFDEEIRVSVLLTGDNKSIQEQDATIKVYITLKNGIKYTLPFKINKDGNIS